MGKRVLFSIFISLLSSSVWAQSSYPELLVQPRSSERIKMEAKTEKETNQSNYTALEVSATVTFLSGAAADYGRSVGYVQGSNGWYWNNGSPSKSGTLPDDTSRAAYYTEAVGLAWLGYSYYLSRTYFPFSEADAELTALPNKTPAEQLVKERLADEKLDAMVRRARVTKWSFALSTALICSNLSNNSGSTGQSMASVCVLSALAPLFIQSNWEQVSKYQNEYKKKIYGPIAMSVLTPNARGGVDPGVMVSWSF